jgi:hypothetical protein
MVAGVITLLSAGGVLAQSDVAPQAPSDLADGQSLSIIDEDVDSLTDKQKLERAAEKIEQVRSQLGSVVEMLKSVRDDERDIIKINCINEKLAAIKGFVKVSEQSYLNLERAVNESDSEAAKHHYTLISVAHQRVLRLVEEARLCTGEVSRFAGRGEMEVDEPDVGDEDIDLPDDGILISDLPDLTPYR